MYSFATAIKSYLAPIVALQVAQQVLVNSGFQVFDPAHPGKITVAGSRPDMGLIVTIVSVDCEGGSATVTNAVCVDEQIAPSAQEMANAVFGAIQAS